MQELSFWGLISSDNINKICIPTIQRDYAQGRYDKALIRNSFLNALKSALLTGKPLTLDFIYGVENDTMFVPLDGQQRLTTLWLLYWYVALKAGKLEEPDVKKTLSKFSYETRFSSTDFCKSLCYAGPGNNKGSLRDRITKQTWFYHHYRQDPTIMGMLNMIAGTGNKNIPDSLESIFGETDCDYQELWNRLTDNSNNLIKFNKLDIKLNDSDELYVKMNARGKQLTDFENFKAELVQHIRDNNILDEEQALVFAAKLDVEWTDIFWENRWEDCNTKDISIDEIYFAFIRRFARLECIRKYESSSEYIKQLTVKFTSFEAYKVIFDQRTVRRFIKLMDNLRGHKLKTDSPWGECFDFVPKYKDKKKNITTLTETQQMMFYGYCRYLIQGGYDEDSFNEWNRVLWNICENMTDSSNLKKTVSVIELLNSHKVIKQLSKYEVFKKWHNERQLLEEQQKARHLAEYPEIKEMEGYAFFKGAIRFLFTGADNNEDWDSFEIKVRNVKELIPVERNKRRTIEKLTQYIEKKDLSVIYYNWISNNDNDLRYIMLLKKAVPYIHNFLLQNGITYTSALHEDIIDLCSKAFDGKAYLQSYWNESKYIWTRYEKRSGYYNWDSFIVGNEQYSKVSEIIDSSESGVLEIYREQKNRRIGKHIQALYLHFIYKKQYYLTMFGNNTICLMTDKWNDKLPNPDNPDGFYFSTYGIETEKDLEERIEFLLEG